MTDLVVIHTKHGSYAVHRHWLDPLSDIIGRYEKSRQKGTWSWDSDIQEWIWVEGRP